MQIPWSFARVGGGHSQISRSDQYTFGYLSRVGVSVGIFRGICGCPPARCSRYLAWNAPLRVLLLVYLGMEMKRVDRGELSNVLKMRTKLRDGWKEPL